MNWRQHSCILRVSNVWLWFCAGLFLLPGRVLAGVETDIGPEFGGGQWVWSFFSLIIVVALAYWATRFLAGRVGLSQARHIKVAESLLLGPNRHLYLLLVDGKVLLVGSTEHGISLIKEFEDNQFHEELLKMVDTGQNTPTGRFAKMIVPVVNSMNSRETMDNDLSDSKQRLQERLEKLRSWKLRGRDHDGKV
ncbi:MAG: FliO/MopB family protein [Firmicutes bacterium]|nr:FliO/MopB family protein [Bacillota bacterium]